MNIQFPIKNTIGNGNGACVKTPSFGKCREIIHPLYNTNHFFIFTLFSYPPRNLLCRDSLQDFRAINILKIEILSYLILSYLSHKPIEIYDLDKIR